METITIDGAEGEGGGQVLRTALTMSLATGRACRLENIRGKRKKAGLLRQHLTAVEAAAAIGDADVEGAEIGSRTLTFAPRAIKAGDYAFAVGTAGSATLVLQTVLLPLLTATTRSTLALEGGTHNPWAPPFDFLARVFLPVLNRLGARVESALIKPGFYPAGGGRFTVTIEPGQRLASLDLIDRGEIVERRVIVKIANLPRHIAEREMAAAIKFLNWSDECGTIDSAAGSPGPGNVVLIEVKSEQVTEIFTGFGEIGTRAEGVSERAAKQARRYLTAGVPVGVHLADQLLPVLALGAGGSFRTLPLTQHTKTNAEVIKRFLDVRITETIETRDVTRVDVEIP